MLRSQMQTLVIDVTQTRLVWFLFFFIFFYFACVVIFVNVHIIIYLFLCFFLFIASFRTDDLHVPNEVNDST